MARKPAWMLVLRRTPSPPILRSKSISYKLKLTVFWSVFGQRFASLLSSIFRPPRTRLISGIRLNIRHPPRVRAANHSPVGVAHLPRDPCRILARRQHHARVGVPHLIRIAIAHASRAQRAAPWSQSERLIARPSRVGSGVAGNFAAKQFGVRSF